MTEQDRKTRRQLLRAGLVVASGVAAVHARAQDKIDPKQVQYQTQPKDGQECDKCVNWAPPNACKIVSGNIDPKGWCIAFAPKES